MSDLRAIVTIHQRAFSEFFLTRLGSEFLQKYYGLVLQYPAGIMLVTEDRGLLEGFVCGFVDPPEFYRLMDRNRIMFVLPVLSALARNPLLTAKVWHGVNRIQAMASEGSARTCELSSIAVVPEAGGNGHGKTLIQAFLSQAWSMNAERVYLTTDAERNDSANTFYRKAGFQQTRSFLQRKGRWMNEYVASRGADYEAA